MPDPKIAMALINQYAPEHLILARQDALILADEVKQAGSVFLGYHSPESVGDYASGTNHTLPTYGYAAAYSGVSVDSFVKKITMQQLSSPGLALIGPTVMTMAKAESLDAHALAVLVRLDSQAEVF
jgi:histidinol dehydrogenase